MNQSPMQMSGFKVAVNNLLENQPKIKLSPKLQGILEAGRRTDVIRDFNDWSKKFFGTQPPFVVDRVNKAIWTNDSGLAFLQKHDRNQQL